MTDPVYRPTPDPGDYDATQDGCICTVRDGEPVDNDRWPDWLTKGCPLHDPNIDLQIGGPTSP